MPPKGGKTSQIGSVRRKINEHMTTVGEEILYVLEKQQHGADVCSLKLTTEFVLERLDAVAEFMCNLFQREIETLEMLLEKQNKLRLDIHPNTADQCVESSLHVKMRYSARTVSVKQEPEDHLKPEPEDLKPESKDHLDLNVLRLPVCKEEVSPDQQKRSSSLVQKEPERPQIKEEPEELLQRPEEASSSTDAQMDMHLAVDPCPNVYQGPPEKTPFMQMAVQGKLTMRVILSAGDIRRLTVTPRPGTVEDLICCLKGALLANYPFSLLYEDPDYGDKMFSLNDISELPEKPTIQVIPIIGHVPIPTTPAVPALDNSTTAEPDLDDSTTAEADLGHSSEADTEITSSNSSQARISEWPEVFEIPKFAVDVEYRLKQGNLVYKRDQTTLKVTKELKHKILETLAQTMYAFKPYPQMKEREAVAKALTEKHPCLAISSAKPSWKGWRTSLEHKMGNYREKMRRMGRLDVSVNGGKRGRYGGGDREPPHKGIKKARKGELNFLPEYPEGLDDHTMEEARQALLNELMMTKPNESLVKKQMDVTFAFRRKEVVTERPAISQMVQRWPSLFTESQIQCEFHRVVGKNLQDHFFGALDQMSPMLIDLFRKKKGAMGQRLCEILIQSKSTEPSTVRSVCLRGLPVILGEDPAVFFRTCSDVSEISLSETPVGILCIDPGSPQLNPSKVGIILEGIVVMMVADLPQAVCLLFGLIYALHLDYPKRMKHTCTFIQQVMLNLGRADLPPRIQSLKDQLEAN